MKNKSVKMRNVFVMKILKLCAIALVAVIGFSMTACNFGGEKDEDMIRKDLDYVYNIDFDYDTKTLSWDAVENAKEYKLFIQDADEDFLPKTTTQTFWTYSDTDFASIIQREDVSFVVIALGYTSGNVQYNSSKWYGGFLWRVYTSSLKKPTGISLNRQNGVLTWEAVPNADYYVIQYEYQGQSQTTEQITALQKDFGETFNNKTPVLFYVQAFSNNPRINKSINDEPYKSYIPLEKPTIKSNTLQKDGERLHGSVSWYKVAYASQYFFSIEYQLSNENIFRSIPSSQINYAYYNDYVSAIINFGAINKTFSQVRFTITAYDGDGVWGSSTYSSQNP